MQYNIYRYIFFFPLSLLQPHLYYFHTVVFFYECGFILILSKFSCKTFICMYNYVCNKNKKKTILFYSAKTKLIFSYFLLNTNLNLHLLLYQLQQHTLQTTTTTTKTHHKITLRIETTHRHSHNVRLRKLLKISYV